MIIKIIIYLILTVSGLTLFKLGSGGIQLSLTLKNISFSITPLSILGILCYGLSFILYLSIVRDNELSYISPVTTGIVTVMTLVVGKTVFKEYVGPYHILGVLLIVAGVFIINIYK